MMEEKIIISAISGVTPVGGNIEQSCCAIRAGINLFEEHEYYDCEPYDPEWDPAVPLVASAYPLNDPLADGNTRMLEMAIQSLKELIANLNFKRKDLSRCGLLLALPELDPATSTWRLQKEFLENLCRKTGLTSLAKTGASNLGRSGALRLIQPAINLLNDNQLDYCIIGGVDSYLAEDRIAFFDKNWRIRSDRTKDGFIPGEACVMFALEKVQTAQARGLTPLASVEAVANERENNPITGDRQSSGVATAAVLEKVLKQHPDAAPLKWTISDINGESYTGYEWGTVLVRNNHYFSPDHQLDHPADCVGELGAAAGALMVAMAAHAFINDYHKADEVFLINAADNGERAAAIVKRI